MEQETRAAAKNAHQIVLSYNDKIYNVDLVKVRLCEGKNKHNAVFHAKEIHLSQFTDLSLDIPRGLYDALVEYAKLNDPDMILVLNVKNDSYNWNLVSDAWVKQAASAQNTKKYIV